MSLAQKRKSFAIRDAARLLGALEHIAKWAPWMRSLFISLRIALINAMRRNRTLVFEGKAMKNFVSDLSLPRNSDTNLLKSSFANSKISKKIWELKTKFFITTSLKCELQLLHGIFSMHTHQLRSPISHLIPRIPEFTAFGDACLEGAGGYSAELQFWFYIEWPEDIKKRTLKHFKRTIKIDHEKFTSINLLEYVTILVLYAAATQAVQDNKRLSKNEYPTIKIMSDNTSALSWTRKVSASTKAGAALGRLFTCLMFNNK